MPMKIAVIGEIQHGKFNAQTGRHLPRIGGILRTAAPRMRGCAFRRLAKAHKNARAVVAGPLEQHGRNTAVDTPAHRYNDTLLF